MLHYFNEQIIADDIPHLAEGLVAALLVSELALPAVVPHSEAAVGSGASCRILLAAHKFEFWQPSQMLLQRNITM